MAVTFDVVGPGSSGHGGASSPVSWTHAGSASATALLVGVGVDASNDAGCLVAVTFNGVSMTQLGPNIHVDSKSIGFIALFGLAGASAAGSHTVSVTVTGGTGVDQVEGGSLSFLGSATTVAGAFGPVFSAFGTSSVQSVNVTSSVSGNIIGGFTASGSPIGAASSPSTARFTYSGTGNEDANYLGGSTTPSTGSAVTVAWPSNGDDWAAAAVEVQAPGSPVIGTTSLPDAQEGQFYYENLQAAGGASPYTWSISAGALPSWASLNGSTGIISGTPPASISSTTFTVKVTDSVSATATQSLTLVVVARDPLQRPFASSSIWNTPIGTGAVYVQPSGNPTYLPVSGSNFTPMPGIDPERIVLAPSAPSTTVAYSSAGWSGTSRCAATGGSNGGLPISVPMPSSYVVPSDNTNSCAAFLQADGRTISQCQPLARCTAGGSGTSIVAMANVDLYGAGITGSHGGSGLSAIGGSIRLGELRPGQTGMRHALKINVDSVYWFAYQSPTGYRWPAVTADAGYSTDYGSSNHGQYPGMLMGALMAIPQSVSLSSLGLLGAPGQQLAWTLQNYGAYIVDSTGGAGFFFSAEEGAQGSKSAEFASDWGYPLADRVASNTAWTNDVQTCMNALQLVDNNSSANVGGGGTPLQPLAPALSDPNDTPVAGADAGAGSDGAHPRLGVGPPLSARSWQH